jgi:hypothetical protein
MTPLPLTENDLLQPLETKLLCLIKFGEERNLKLLAEGKIYCRHLEYYKAEENRGKVFYDQHEGLAGFYQAKNISIHFTPKNQPPVIINADNGLVGQVPVSLNLKKPAFCMYAIHTGEWTNRKFTEQEMEDFKSYLQVTTKMENGYKNKHVWVITSGIEFNERLGKACKAKNIGLRGDLVRYVDAAFHGTVPRQISGFVKTNEFSHEREYRYVFDAPDLPDPFILDVGSLKDISTIVPVEDFKNSWSIQFEE